MAAQKYTCPVCGKEATGEQRLYTHFMGAHVDNPSGTMDVLSCLISIQSRGGADGDYHATSYLIDRFRKQFDPGEPTGAEKDQETKVSYDLVDYLSSKSPICREERQYAHLLAKDLESDEPRFAEQLGIDGRVLQVIFEVTLMRDLWSRSSKEERVRFTTGLGAYVEGLRQNGGLRLVGEKDEPTWKTSWEDRSELHKHPNHIREVHPYIRWMMNAKPDLGVLYQDVSGEVRLLFLECKYLSGGGKYTESGTDGKLSGDQLDIQRHILEFLCYDRSAGGDATGAPDKPALKHDGRAVHPDEAGVKTVKFYSEENQKAKGPQVDYGEVINISLSELLSRWA